jgi:AcrR family transcriptional regulator
MPQRALRELRQARKRRDDELRQLVAKALRRGARTQDIADALGISRSTFWRRYTDELRRNEQPNLRSRELQRDPLGVSERAAANVPPARSSDPPHRR